MPLGGRPTGFEVLRPGGAPAAPELRQLISFSLYPTLQAVAAAGGLELPGVAPSPLQQQAKQHGGGGGSDEGDLVVSGLLARLSPELAICLLAEVAVGLLGAHGHAHVRLHACVPACMRPSMPACMPACMPMQARWRAARCCRFVHAVMQTTRAP